MTITLRKKPGPVGKQERNLAIFSQAENDRIPISVIAKREGISQQRVRIIIRRIYRFAGIEPPCSVCGRTGPRPGGRGRGQRGNGT